MERPVKMQYRRFGRTELAMPVFSCGGMRYQQAWKDLDPEVIEAGKQANLEATIHRAIEVGINHVETARGYGSSEMQLGRVLPSFPREDLIVQTKVAPSDDPEKFRATLEKSLGYLQLDYVDLFGFHGVNNDAVLDQVVRPGGCLEVIREFQREGQVRHVGFSTHGGRDEITRAIDTGEFDYVNIHWYWVNDRNWPAIEAAKRRDMGVFIISPNDKGGKLYDPPPKLAELCAPLTPMEFNDLFCLLRPEVNTLSVGAAQPSDFDVHLAALERLESGEAGGVVAEISGRLDQCLRDELGAEWMEGWERGIPEWNEIPGGLNVWEMLRLGNLATGLGMVEFGKMRYNMLGNAGHWCPGENASEFDEDAVRTVLGASPFAGEIPGRLREIHELLYEAPKKRLSESDD
ncbi:MAG: aldo/keto reductase [Chthoniobacterales bacterium]